MTTIARPTASPQLARRGGWRSRLALSCRLIRRGAALIWLASAAYMATEVLVFRSAYPDEASRQKLLELSGSAAVRMLQGTPAGADSAGGFAVWDGGWMLAVIVACWALLTATRLTRGEEDTGRAELALSRPLTARQALRAHLAALAVAAGGVAVSAALPFLLLGEPAAGAVLWGAGAGALCAVAGALGAVVAQLVEPRRHAIALGLAILAAAFLVRVLANSTDRRSWLLTVAPFGWLERLRPFAGDDWGWLAPPLVAAALLAGAALVVCGRRDSGAAPVHPAGTRRSSFRLLGSAAGFGWRSGAGALLGWALTLATVTFVFGLMTGALVDFINTDDSYRRMLESMGMDMSVPAVGYLSYIAVFLALPFAAFLGWRIGAARQEEADGRLDNLLARGVERRRWLAATAGQALLAAVLLVAAATAALWTGARAVSAPVSTWQVIEPMLGTLPLIVLFTGIAVLTFGLAPRLTVAVPVTAAVLSYLLDTFGTALSWPRVVLTLAPFHHLARLPGHPMTAPALVAMTGIGVVAAAAGIVAFARRDLRGA